MRSLCRLKRRRRVIVVKLDQFVPLGLKFKMSFWYKVIRLLFDESLALCSLTHGLTQVNSTLGQKLHN